MINNNIRKKRGFTIIEVVLVLAIAGLIFLMVFIALPALQRSQRNTQRRDDYSMLVTAVNSYMASNNGKLSNLIKNSAPTPLTASRWVNSTGEDPNGNPYEVIAYLGVSGATASGSSWGQDQRPNGSLSKDTGSCSDTKMKTSAECEAAKATWTGGKVGDSGSQVFVIIKASCKGTDGEGDPEPMEDSSNRAFAVYGYLEGGGYFCQDSGSIGSNT